MPEVFQVNPLPEMVDQRLSPGILPNFFLISPEAQRPVSWFETTLWEDEATFTEDREHGYQPRPVSTRPVDGGFH